MTAWFFTRNGLTRGQFETRSSQDIWWQLVRLYSHFKLSIDSHEYRCRSCQRTTDKWLTERTILEIEDGDAIVYEFVLQLYSCPQSGIAMRNCHNSMFSRCAKYICREPSFTKGENVVRQARTTSHWRVRP